MPNQKSFIIRLLGLSAFVEVASLGWFFSMPAAWVSPLLPYMPLFFMLVTYVIHRTFITTLGKSPRAFVTRYMLITTIKLFSFLALIFLYVILQTHDAVQFLVSFLLMYVIYSGFEAVAVINLNDQQSKQGSKG